jgi:hypothetical protein
MTFFLFNGKDQVCQMAYFRNKNSNVCKLWWVLQWKMLVHMYILHMAIWSVLRPFGIFYGYLVYFFPVSVGCAKKNLATLGKIK